MNNRWMGEKYDGIRCVWHRSASTLYPADVFVIFIMSFPLYSALLSPIIFILLYFSSLFFVCFLILKYIRGLVKN